jgi:hypothetical protein
MTITLLRTRPLRGRALSDKLARASGNCSGRLVLSDGSFALSIRAIQPHELSLIAEHNTRIERVKKDLELLVSADERVRRVRTHPGIELSAVGETDGLEVNDSIYFGHGFKLTRLTAMTAPCAPLSTFRCSRSIARLMMKRY